MTDSLKLLTAISLSVFLSACGGGGSSDDSSEETPVSSDSGSDSGSGSGSGSDDDDSGSESESEGDSDSDSDNTSEISGGTGSVSEDSETSTSGQLIDSAESNQSFEAGNFQGSYGTLETTADGSWTYTLDSDLADPIEGTELVVDTFTIGVGNAGTNTTISISITGYDDAYTFNPGSPLATLVVDSKTFAAGTLLLEDIDGNTPTFVESTVSGNYGDFKLFTDGDWEYSLNAAANGLKDGESTEDSLTFQLSDGSTQSVTFSVVTIEPTESSIVFIFMNFSDASATDTADISDIANMVFNNVDSLDKAYQENSLGQLKFLRHRIGDNSLAHYCYGEAANEASSIDCVSYDIPDSQEGGILSVDNAVTRASQGGEYTDEGFSWRDDASQWAQDNLVDENNSPLDLGDWRHRVFIYPSAAKSAGLVGAGIASVGGKWSMVAAYTDQVIMGHELGHNIGLSHAGNDLNNDGDTNDSGESEYGTDGTLMGNAWQSRLFGSGHREYMGWYDLFPEYSETVAQTAGSYEEVQIQAVELTAGELTGTLPQQLKVESVGSSNGENYYYVNYHVAHDILNPASHMEGSVSIHYLDNRLFNHVSELKQTGDRFTDSNIGLTIEFKSMDSDTQSALISVSYSE
ncbi:VCBS domain-containing protein [Microbulbifer sp. OS29]|uniref:VCBS domain-containing protein n=1 Tax=Microbulbifer okhotskensis TaxID=2926617 RepID=A0A9X2J6D6_9GAMM|nr:VCBS domain-containing protein [Microbulbifer okhotskensis]MCO1335309.1 VCBS domain-containing protein [Microbulbifer okhotskensis]